MNKKVKIWGREFQLKVIFDVFDDEEIMDTQVAALDAFLGATENLFKSCDELINYCLKRDSDNIGSSIDHIFKYVMPESIYVGRSKRKHVVSLLCNYRYDEEHGIALTYENEQLKCIGPQDDIL